MPPIELFSEVKLRMHSYNRTVHLIVYGKLSPITHSIADIVVCEYLLRYCEHNVTEWPKTGINAFMVF